MARLGRSYAKRPVILNGAFFPGQIAASYLTLYPTSTTTSLAGGYSGAVLADSPMAYWRMDAASGTTESDITGNGHTLTYHNTGDISYSQTGATTDADKAIHFGGTNAYATAALDLSGTNQVTAEFWMNASMNLGGDQLAMEFTPNTNSSTGGFFVDPNASSTEAFYLASAGSVGLNRYHTTAAWGGAYHHFVCVFDRTQTTQEEFLYVDGSSVTLDPADTNNNSNNFANDTLYLASRAGSALFYSCTLDEVAIYTYALTGAQALAHYNAA